MDILYLLNEQRTSWIAYVFWLQNFMNNVFSSYISICVLVCSCLWAHGQAWDRFWVSSITFYLIHEAGSVKWTWELANVLEWLSGFQELELQADHYAHPTSTWMLGIKSDSHAFVAATLNHELLKDILNQRNQCKFPYLQLPVEKYVNIPPSKSSGCYFHKGLLAKLVLSYLGNWLLKHSYVVRLRLLSQPI